MVVVDVVVAVQEDKSELGCFDGDVARARALDDDGVFLALQATVRRELITHGLASPGEVELVGSGMVGRLEILDLDGRGGDTGDGILDGDVVGTRGVGDIVKQRKLDRDAVLVHWG